MKTNKKSKAKQSKKAANEQSQPKKDKLKLDVDFKLNVGNQIADYIQNTEPDNIYGIYDDSTHSLGVKEVIYSGLPNLEKILARKRDTDIYGIPLNKMVELYGDADTSKTTLSKYLCCNFIKQGGVAFFVDFEHKFDPIWLKKIGSGMGLIEEDYKRFKYTDPVSFEWFVIWLIKLMRTISELKNKARISLKEEESKKKKSDDSDELKNKYLKIINTPVIVVIDSVAAMYTENEVAGQEESNRHVAELARGFSEKLKLIRRLLGDSNMFILWVNQERSLISMGGQQVRPGTMQTTGGKALKYFLDGRLRIVRAKTLKRTRDNVESKYGVEYLVTCTKTQMGTPIFGTANLRLIYGHGIQSFFSVLESCSDVNLIKRVGSRYKMKGKTIEIEFDSSSLEETQIKYPQLEQTLHNNYKRFMEKPVV